ncbi:hypothetical protein GOODEAATRI_001590 [Goodea atripinnis]|uniref:Uncharacterized protein n=1 Tax=Goodea atripinnis TaxID=208336 RepID=A0ABV0PUP9_9TELE
MQRLRTGAKVCNQQDNNLNIQPEFPGNGLDHMSQTQARGPNLAHNVIIFGLRDNSKCLLERACQQTTHAQLMLQIPEYSAGALACQSGPTSPPPFLTFISKLHATISHFRPPLFNKYHGWPATLSKSPRSIVSIEFDTPGLD